MVRTMKMPPMQVKKPAPKAPPKASANPAKATTKANLKVVFGIPKK